MPTAALGAIYRSTSGVPALADTVIATIARLNSISSLAPSCAIPSVSGKSFATRAVEHDISNAPHSP
jgi:hypothetical protein